MASPGYLVLTSFFTIVEMNLISTSIKSMGDPNSEGFSKSLPTSIKFSDSIRDWWNSSSYLKIPSERVAQLDHLTVARDKNLQTEYGLFRAILSSDIYIHRPKKSAAEDMEQSKLPITGRFLDVDLEPGVDNNYIHEFELVNASDLSLPKRHIVFIHGYMAAMGYFVKNLEDFARLYGNLSLHVIDMPGYGNSSRPLFPSSFVKISSNATHDQKINRVINTENWFIDKFEAWRKVREIDHFDLIAHSMGAYLSSCYLMKYNQVSEGKTRVGKFIVVSPMGTESSDASLINNSKLQYNHHEAGGYPLREIIASLDFKDHDTNHEELEKLWDFLGRPKFPANTLLKTLWEWNVSPFQLLQLFGPMYSKILSYWSFQRFKNLKANNANEENTQEPNPELILKLHEYSYSIFNQYQGSGEVAITILISHEILARLPLCDRGFPEFLQKTGVKSMWMYGDKDWMNQKGGEYCVQKLKELGDETAELKVIKNAGHHLYLDNPTEFNKVAIEFLSLC